MAYLFIFELFLFKLMYLIPDWNSVIATTISTTTTTQGQSEIKSALVCLEDYERAAANILDLSTLDYYRSGADDEITLRENRLAFKRITISPRSLVDVSKRNISTTILGKRVSFPVGVAPAAFQKLATPEGEKANARAAAAAGTIYILSTMSTTSMEEVAAAAPEGRKWFQLYVFKNRSLTAHLVHRAASAGYEALVVTVDAPLYGKRRADIRNKFRLPSYLSLANFEGEIEVKGDSAHSNVLERISSHLDDGLTWSDITWLKSITRLPVYLKGILSPDDAELAVEYGVQGVYVSNHGGRQMDTVSATIDVLPEIVERVAGRCDVIFDGGIRTGTDIFKALAYGAKMVFVGRPMLWGLAVDGEEGAKNVLKLLKNEFNSTLALAGVQSVNQISKNYIIKSA